MRFLSKQEVFVRFLQQADVLTESGQLITAAILAGIVLEETIRLLPFGTALGKKDQIDLWREMRNQAAHSEANRTSVLTTEQVREMVSGIRGMLHQTDEKFEGRVNSLWLINALTPSSRQVFICSNIGG